MGIRRFKKYLERREFFIDIEFRNKKSKKEFVEWLYELNNHGIIIYTLKDLFPQWKIRYPIEIGKVDKPKAKFINFEIRSSSETYVLGIDEKDAKKYYIESEEERLEKHNEYNIRHNRIIIVESQCIEVSRGTKRTLMVNNKIEKVLSHVTIPTIKVDLEISYNQDSENNQRDIEYMLLLGDFDCDDLWNLFTFIVINLSNKDEIYMKAEHKKHGKVSEIRVQNGFVTEYMYTIDGILRSKQIHLDIDTIKNYEI